MLKQCCDRYGTSKGIEAFRLVVQRVGVGNQSLGPPGIDRICYLGPRGIEWLTKILEREISKLDSQAGESKP
jgi:hypothetical protein